MQRDVDLWIYLPEFLHEFLELDKTLLAEEPEFQHLFETLEIIRDDLFILTATDDGLKKYESILNIKPSPDDGLEERRNIVLSRWNDTTNFTIRAFQKKIVTIQGNDKVQVYMDKNDPFILHIECNMKTIGQMNTFLQLLKIMVPANILSKVENQIDYIPDFQLYCGITFVYTNSLTAETTAAEGVQADFLGDTNDDWLSDENGLILFDEVTA